MLQEERERNREMNELLKTRCSDLEEELTHTREELRSTRDRLGKKVLYVLMVVVVVVVFTPYTPTCCKG
jgi:hypothetical protein